MTSKELHRIKETMSLKGFKQGSVLGWISLGDNSYCKQIPNENMFRLLVTYVVLLSRRQNQVNQVNN